MRLVAAVLAGASRSVGVTSPFYGPPLGQNTVPTTPTITASESAVSALLTSSAFADDDVGDTHAASQWQVTLTADTGYASPVYDSGEDASNLTGVNATGLAAETGYRCQVRHKDSAGGWSAYSTDATFTTAAAGAAEETIAVAVTRLAAGTGSGLCSTGIPLYPGLLENDETANVKVTVDGVEQAIYVEALGGRHSDGSLRSILVQFNDSVDYGSPLSGTVEVGAGVSRTTEDISKTAISWSAPVIACTPTDVDYLISCDMTLPLLKESSVIASPAFHQQYDTEFVSYGNTHWDAEYPAASGQAAYNYYDRALCWFEYWIRTGTFEYWRRGILQAAEYAAILAYEGSYGSCQAPRNQMFEGVDLHYHFVGYEQYRTAVVFHAEMNDIAWTPKLDNDPASSYMEGRISARTVMAMLMCHRMGDTSQDWTTKASTAIDDIMSVQNGVDGSYDEYVVWDYLHSPYMTALVAHAFIFYYTFVDAKATIPPSIKAALDFEWDNMWVSADESFKYLESSAGGSPDLNQLIVLPNSWYYAYSADATYLTRANAIHQGGVDGAYLGAANNGFKQFNQNYRQGWHYQYYRLGSL